MKKEVSKTYKPTNTVLITNSTGQREIVIPAIIHKEDEDGNMNYESWDTVEIWISLDAVLNAISKSITEKSE